MEQSPTAGDELLNAWLSLTSSLWNTRLVSRITFNETHVLGILLRHPADQPPMSATDLIRRTNMLKSQMNKLLTGLEQKGFILRERSSRDRRFVHITLTDLGKQIYLQEHEHIETLVNRLVDRIGEEEARRVSGSIGRIVTTLDHLLADEEA